MTTLWLTDAEVDDLCAGLKTNAAKTRHLRGMGLVVNAKPNGRPLVVRSHAEAVLSGLQQLQAGAPPKAEPIRPNRDALVMLLRPRKATV